MKMRLNKKKYGVSSPFHARRQARSMVDRVWFEYGRGGDTRPNVSQPPEIQDGAHQRRL
jgi:hypothetical protein